jgi:hypothetical protein
MKKVFPLAFCLILAACSWVKVTSEGESVRLVESLADVAECEKIGTAMSQVVSKVIFSRDEETMAGELADLARNHAAQIGGDTIVPISDIKEGQRTFGVYKCVKP